MATRRPADTSTPVARWTLDSGPPQLIDRKRLTPVNLYAILPVYSPGREVQLVLAKSDADALNNAVYDAARDACKGNMSTAAEAYLVAADLRHVGIAHASAAPATWEWAHPGVEEAIADEVLLSLPDVEEP